MSAASKPVQQHHPDRRAQRQFSRVLVSAPEFFAVSEAHNPFARIGVPVDNLLALRQWEALCSALRHAGLEVSRLEPWPGLEEMCFAASQAFVGVDHDERSFAVLSRMLHRSRRDEVEHFARWYSSHGYRIIDLDLQGEDFLEGASDLLWNPDWSTIWAGYGHRSTSAAVDQFRALMEPMGFDVCKLELVDPYFYHLNLCFVPLGSDAVLLYPGAFSPETLKAIRTKTNTYEVSREEALHFACNGIAVNGYYITARLKPQIEQVLAIEGLQPIVVDLSEFHKAGASVASLKMLLP